MADKMRRRRTTVTLIQGDDLEQIFEMRRAIAIAERSAEEKAAQAVFETLRYGESGDDENAAEELTAQKRMHDEFVAEAAKRATVVTLEALGGTAFRKFRAEHPPRFVKDPTEESGQRLHEDDEDFGINKESALLPLLTASVKDPSFLSTDELTAWIDDLPEGDQDRLFSAAFWLNKTPGADPKELAYLPTTPEPSAT